MLFTDKKEKLHVGIEMKQTLYISMGIFGTILLILFLLPSKDEQVEQAVQRVIQYGFEVRNSSNTLAKDVDFWTYAPVKRTSSQKLERLTVSYPHELIEDKLGNQIVHIHFDFIPPFSSKIVNVQAELMMSDELYGVDLKDQSLYLGAEKFIEVNHPDIQKAAKAFSGHHLSDVKSIYQWVANHVQGVAYVREDRGALYALNHKSGDCTEYAYLFTAMCRAKGVPSRVLGGYVMAENGKLSAESYHNWSEFYYDGVWNVSDPQMKVFMQQPSRFVTMNIIQVIMRILCENFSVLGSKAIIFQ